MPAEPHDENTPLLESNRADISKTMVFWTLGALYGATAVGMGAFGSHGLKKRIPDPQRIVNWNTAAHYQLVHSGILMLTAAAAPSNKVAAGLFTVGMTLFSGSIYLLVLNPEKFRAVGPVTPIGGLCLIGGWVALAVGSRGRITRL